MSAQRVLTKIRMTNSLFGLTSSEKDVTQYTMSSNRKNPILQVKDLTKIYRRHREMDVVAVNNIGFSVEPNEVVGLLGPNGAGKTTTIKYLCTLIRPSSGEITIDNINALSNPRKALKKIAAVFERNRNIYWRLTPIENLEFFAGIQGIPTSRTGICLL